MIATPYILVGHSHGGSIARMFAHRYPEDVAGLVLVDPNHEDQFDRIERRNNLTELKVMTVAARFGVLRLLDPLADLGAALPPDALDQYRSVGYSTAHNRGFLDEAQTFRDVVSEQMQREDIDLGDLPVTIMHATAAEWDAPAVVEDMQRKLLATSSRSRWIDVDADHYSIVTEEHHARAIADVVLGMTDDA